MQEYASEAIRNIAVVGHGQVGKTSLLEACLFKTGAVSRLGAVSDGTSTLDSDEEERKRQFTIGGKLVAVEWNGAKLNLLDTPGYPDLVGEVRGALAAADAALLVVSAPDGVEVETEKDWALLQGTDKPRAFYVNKMDREHADFVKVMAELRGKFGTGVVAVTMPIGSADKFEGVADLLDFHDIPEDMKDDVELARAELVEALADFDDDIAEKFLEGEEVSSEMMLNALAVGVAAGKVYPVYSGCATTAKGMRKLLNGLVKYMPAPGRHQPTGLDADGNEAVRDLDGPFSAQVYKTVVDPFVGRVTYLRIFSGELRADATVHNVNRESSERLGGLFTMQGGKQLKLAKAAAGDIVATTKLSATKTGDTLAAPEAPITYPAIEYPASMLVMAVRAEKKDELEKIVSALERESDGDPTLQITRERETHEILVHAQGEVQIDIAGSRVKRRNNLKATFDEPRIALRETIRGTAQAQGKHKKQSGGHGQYGDVWLEISPMPAGEGNVFEDAVVGGAVPRQFIPAVEKGTLEIEAAGILAGYPIVDMKVKLYDGSFHAVDSSEAAFKTATSLAMKKAFAMAKPVLLEPIYDMTVTLPEEHMGDVMGQLSSRRAKIMGMESAGNASKITAKIPGQALYRYATDLRAQTRGRGSFLTEFSHYEQMPEAIAKEFIEKKKEQDEADAAK